MTDILTRIERPGTYVMPRMTTLREREAFSLHVATLRTQGHAVIVDEVFEPESDKPGDIRVFHYMTCARCREDSNARKV